MQFAVSRVYYYYLISLYLIYYTKRNMYVRDGWPVAGASAPLFVDLFGS